MSVTEQGTIRGCNLPAERFPFCPVRRLVSPREKPIPPNPSKESRVPVRRNTLCGG